MSVTQLKTAPAKALRDSPISGRMLIGGKLVESSDGGWIECINPANEDYIGKVPRGNAADVERAVEFAEAAQVKWAALSVAKRSEYLMRLGGVGRERGMEELYSYTEEKSIHIML